MHPGESKIVHDHESGHHLHTEFGVFTFNDGKIKIDPEFKNIFNSSAEKFYNLSERSRNRWYENKYFARKRQYFNRIKTHDEFGAVYDLVSNLTKDQFGYGHKAMLLRERAASICRSICKFCYSSS